MYEPLWCMQHIFPFPKGKHRANLVVIVFLMIIRLSYKVFLHVGINRQERLLNSADRETKPLPPMIDRGRISQSKIRKPVFVQNGRQELSK